MPIPVPCAVRKNSREPTVASYIHIQYVLSRIIVPYLLSTSCLWVGYRRIGQVCVFAEDWASGYFGTDRTMDLAVIPRSNPGLLHPESITLELLNVRLVEPPYIVCLPLELWYTPGRVRCGSTSDTLLQSYIFSFSCSIPLRVRYNFGTAPSWLRQYSKFCHDRSPSPCDLIGGELTEYRKREGEEAKSGNSGQFVPSSSHQTMLVLFSVCT